MTEYHLVVTPNAFQSSLEVDFCCRTESDWSYGPADKVREPRCCIWSIITAYTKAPSGLKMEKTNPSVLYNVHESLKKEGQTPTGRCKAECSGSSAVRYSGWYYELDWRSG